LLVGGAERVLCTLVKGLAQDFDQTVIYVHDGPMRAELVALGIPVVQVQGLFTRYDPWFFVRLYRAVRKVQPDLVHTLLWAANVAGRIIARMLRIPVVSAYHNNIGQDGYVRSLFDRCTIGQAQAIVAVSQQVAAGIQQRSPHIQPAVIPNGITLQSVVIATSRAALGIASDAWLVGAVGRFVPLKRFDLLLDAVAKLDADRHIKLHLLLIGYGPLEQQYREQIQALEIADKVTLLINRPAADYMHLIDVFVQPSGLEGISLALLEAMASAKLCMVMPDDGVHPVITHGINGLVVRGGSAAALAEALQYAYTRHDVCQNIAQNALQSVNASFSASAMVAGYRIVFKRVVQG
jgi:glycosyltransferase involved in cell wall biosynthesis